MTEQEIEKRFIAVVHTWFVDSKGFYVQNLDVTTREEADKEAAVLYREYNERMRHAEVLIIELIKGERPRRLTIWERLTGRLS